MTDDAPNPLPQVVSRARLDAALAALTAAERRLFEWSRRHGLTLREIARRLGRPREVVAKELVRALRAVRTQLADGSDRPPG
jgi:RNA polymerase sigma factor (sigma-70 family)